ncbi:putative acetyl transferase [Sporocytophaga myxococcoides]|uniref:Putative acetyl transferase n=1 Tax=Sporocytophaga myxococcoides TaxID=153721 RepID=A0A098LI79_9BACT|nr:DUF1919 domain-containing protein [Sporocytophaga myxococcoides]GAL86711.1 putative acetyl transferase [Sporocytophaga myxococcoides]
MSDQIKPVKFSVVVSTHNHELHLIKALRNIFAQEHDFKFEVIITDNCSTDKTKEIIDLFQLRYPDYVVPLFHDKKNKFSENTLETFKKCKGQYTFLLDPDDYWTDNKKIKKQISFLDEHPEYIFSCHRFNRLIEDTNELLEDFHPVVFKDKPDGFEFGQERYFDYWITQLSTMAIRTECLNDIPKLETFKYYWDTQLFWLLLLKGKGFVQPFFGSVYRVKSETSGNKFDLLKQNSLTYLIIKELHQLYSCNKHIKRIYELYQKNLSWSKSANKRQLNINKINNKNFTIVSDDNWGKEVYDAFNIPYKSPFIGVHLFNSDFIKLVNDFENYIDKPITFINHSDSKHQKSFRHCFGKDYPLGLLNNDIELHFIDYNSPDEALRHWNDGRSKINLENIFFKMDASREENNIDSIEAFDYINRPNKVCFINYYDKEKYLSNNSTLHLIDYWNPDSEIFFPQSLCSFDLIGWLNGKVEKYNEIYQQAKDIFITPDKRKYFFIQFNQDNIHTLDSKFHPETHEIFYNEDTESAIVNYNKHDLEYFCLSAQECPHPKTSDLFIDLSEKENRHIMVLAKGNPLHQLRIDFIGKEEDEKDTILHIDAIAQTLQEDYQWLHFDFSFIDDVSTAYLFSRIRSFYFYLNPKNAAQGTLELMAFYSGSMETFKELLG